MKVPYWFLLGVIFLTACWDDNPPPTASDDMDPLAVMLTDSLSMLMEESAIPGLAVTVVKDSKISYQKTFGKSNVFFEFDYTNSTTQPIGSVSKTFIAVAIMKAIELGYFNLESNINDLLPFEIINPHSPSIPIQVKHLVTHTSGFFDSEEAYTLNYHILSGEDLNTSIGQVLLSYGIEVNDGMVLRDYLEAVFIPEGEFYNEENYHLAGPGLEYEYSNIAASLAAYLIEEKAGMSYADFVSEHILDPLEMNHSTLNLSNVDQIKSSLLYISKDHPLPRYSHPSYPDGFMHTSNDNMGLFLLEMLAGAEGKGQILSDESYSTMFSTQSPFGDYHGVFWDLTDGRIEHSGADPGILAFLSFDSSSQTGFYLATNINGDGLGTEVGVDDGIAFDQLERVIELIREYEKK